MYYEHLLNQFLTIYFYAFIVCTFALPAYRKRTLKRNEPAPRKIEPSFLETVISTVLFIISVRHVFHF